jgi:hypothetical protein
MNAKITTNTHPMKLNHRYGMSVKRKNNKTNISAIIAAMKTELPRTFFA